MADLSNLDEHNQCVEVLQAFAISFDDSDLLDELRDIGFGVDRTLAILDVELFNPKPTQYPGIGFPGEL